MGLESSKRTALRFLETTVTGDIDGLEALLADDCRVFVAGELASSGWKNKSEFMTHMRRVGGGKGSMFAGPVRFDVGYVTAEDDRVCVEAEIHGPLSAGGEYNNQFHFFLRTRGDQLVEIKEYMDTLHVSRVVVGIQTIDGPRVSALTSISVSIPATAQAEQ
jgi:ketosteroid isomerase-like protein